MESTNTFLDFITEALVSIPYPKQPNGLYAPIKYTLDGGGKRIRPVLMLATCSALGGNYQDCKDQAIGIEMFHNFTLLHDDVMDNADIRRGRPTVHRRWNEATAILSGDAMLTMATQYIGHNPAILDLFNRTAMEIYEGQQYDMDFEHRTDVTVDEYMEMIRLKTSVLLGCACRIGAIIAGANEVAQQAFYDYGINLGLAFQLQDDYLDTYGNPLVFGKEIGGDIINDKKTWLLINALNEDKSGVIDKYLGVKNDDQAKILAVKQVYDSLNLPTRCHDLINVYIERAIDSIGSLDLTADAREYFVNLAKKSSTRTH